MLLLVAVPPLAGGARPDAIDEGPPVRVLLLEGPQITIGAAGASGLRLRDQHDRPLLEVEPGRQLRVRRSGASLTLEPLADSRLPAPPERPDSAVPRLIPLQELRLEPLDGRGLLVLKQRRYRGTLLLRAQGEGLQAINRLPLES